MFPMASNDFSMESKDLKIQNHADLIRSIKSQLENKLHLDDIFMKSKTIQFN